MKIKSYEHVLQLTRKQAVNLLEGRFTNNKGIPTNTARMSNTCYGCEYKKVNKHDCPDCPLYIVANRIGCNTCITIRYYPGLVFDAINMIDTILMERANED